MRSCAAASTSNALVIGAEVLTRFLDFTDRNTCILFGDGAGAVVLSASDEAGRRHGRPGADHRPGWRLHDLAAVRRLQEPAVAPRPSGRGEHYVRMEGRETYRFATKTLASSALKAIERAGWKPEEVDLFIPHQANIRIIESVAKGLGLSMDKMFVNVDRYGNTSAASVPIALSEAVDVGAHPGRQQDRVRGLRRRLHQRRGAPWSGPPIRPTAGAPTRSCPSPRCATRSTGTPSIPCRHA